MKRNNISRLFFGAAAASALTLVSCTDNSFTYDDIWIDREEIAEEDPNDPDNPVVEPTYDFQVMSKTVKIDADVRFQVLDGIGASDCWLPNVIGKHWTSNRSRLAELLFSQEIVNDQPKGIGLSTWRVNLGAGTEELGAASGIDDDNANNRAPSYATANSTAQNIKYDWTKCEGQRYFMEQAKNMGVESFVMFSNSPLVQFTRNGKGISQSWGWANLKDDCYGPFAQYMAEVAAHFTAQGYNISHISPVNEPQYNWNGSNQEGSGWQNTQIACLARELQSALDSKGINTMISLGEAGAWDCLYEGDNGNKNVLARFLDPSSDAYVGDLSRVDNISAHSYYTDGNWGTMRTIRSQAANAAAKYGKKLWQTEWSMLVNGPNHYGDNLTDATTHWQIAQYMAMVMHNDFTVAGVNAWHYWTAMSVERWNQRDRFMLINCVPEGGQYDNDFTREGKIEDFRTLWVLGNYSRFVRPGFQRIDLNMIENENFFGDAWISPDGKQIVCVYTNRQAERGVKLKLNYASFPGEVKEIHTYTTTEIKNLEGKNWPTQFPIVLDPSSVTTVVYDLY